jgi:hypothetical protein
MVLVIPTLLLQIVCLGIFIGCVSERTVDTVTAAMNNPTLTQKATLAGLVLDFQAAKQRWPTNQEELSDFIAKSNGKLPTIPYDHVDFTPKWFGRLGVYATSPSITNHMTLSTREVVFQ